MEETIPMDMVSYTTIRGTNKVVRVGDSVLMSPSDQSDQPRVALVEWIDRDDSNNFKVHVIWYYRPEDSFGGRRQFHGARELFLSDKYGVLSVDTIQGKCVVHSLKNYTELRTVNAWDYYCRLHYKVSTGTFTPDEIAVYCKCEMPYNPDEFMLQCKGCEDWFHPLCVGLTIGYAKKLDQFVCPDCSSDEGVTKFQTTFPDSPAPSPASTTV